MYIYPKYSSYKFFSIAISLLLIREVALMRMKTFSVLGKIAKPYQKYMSIASIASVFFVKKKLIHIAYIL